MICVKCDHDLAECICPDLEERFNQIAKSKFVHIGEEYKARILAHIEKQKGAVNVVWSVIIFGV